MLQAKDLMIGDLVRISDDDTDMYFETKIAGVSEIGNVYARLPEGEHAYPLSEDCVTPIPLTPEILEKNGWTYAEFYSEILIDGWQMQWDGNAIRARFEDRYEVCIPCQYVHKLQHALRLCRIVCSKVIFRQNGFEKGASGRPFQR